MRGGGGGSGAALEPADELCPADCCTRQFHPHGPTPGGPPGEREEGRSGGGGGGGGRDGGLM